MVKDMANISVAIKQDVAYGLLIGIFTFDLGASKGQGQSHVQWSFTV